jgi:predicted PhzF superfamily epimerase YddE/YHI9
MTSLPFFQVDAFITSGALTGNPAAVMPLERWLDDALMQAIATENNLSETAFTVPSQGEDTDYDLRWFTPANEVDLCGHATIAAGHVLMTGQPVRFSTRSGMRSVSRREDMLELDLPAARLEEGREPDMLRALGLPTRRCGGQRDATTRSWSHSRMKRRFAPSRLTLPLWAASTAWPASPRPATARRSRAGCSSHIAGSTRTP